MYLGICIAFPINCEVKEKFKLVHLNHFRCK